MLKERGTSPWYRNHINRVFRRKILKSAVNFDSNNAYRHRFIVCNIFSKMPGETEFRQQTVKVPIQVTDLSVQEVIQKIVENGQEDGFFICNLSEIVGRYQQWQRAMPRVKPFYGRSCADSFL